MKVQQKLTLNLDPQVYQICKKKTTYYASIRMIKHFTGMRNLSSIKPICRVPDQQSFGDELFKVLFYKSHNVKTRRNVAVDLF